MIILAMTVIICLTLIILVAMVEKEDREKTRLETLKDEYYNRLYVAENKIYDLRIEIADLEKQIKNLKKED